MSTIIQISACIVILIIITLLGVILGYILANLKIKTDQTRK